MHMVSAHFPDQSCLAKHNIPFRDILEKSYLQLLLQGFPPTRFSFSAGCSEAGKLSMGLTLTKAVDPFSISFYSFQIYLI